MQNNLGSDQKSVLYFIIHFVIVCLSKYPIHVTSAQGTTQNTLHIA